MNALVALTALLLTAAGPKQVRLVAPDLKAQGGVPEPTASMISEVLSHAIGDVRPDRLQLVTSSMMASVVGLERQRQLLGCGAESACLVEIGNALGADLMVSGTLGRLGSTYVLSVQVIDLTRAASELSVVREVRGADEDLLPAARSVGKEIGEALVRTRVKALEKAEADKAAHVAASVAPPAMTPATPIPATGTPPAGGPNVAVAARPATTPSPSPAALPTAANPAGKFPGAMPGFPYGLYPAPPLAPKK